MRKNSRDYIDQINFINIVFGIVYLIFRYFYKIDGPFGEESSSYQKYFQYAHILLVPFLIFGIGLIWNEHIWPKLQSQNSYKRRSGIFLIILFITMSISGYFVQLPLALQTRNYIGISHSAIGVFWVVVFYYHRLKK